jgi:hypothetical protein
MSTLGIVFLCLALVLITISIMLAIYDEQVLILVSLPGAFLLIVPIVDTVETPKDNDVKNGKAHYVETKHQEIGGDDTIRYSTYEIKWKEE